MTAWCGFGQKNEFAAVDSGVKRNEDFLRLVNCVVIMERYGLFAF